MLPFEALYQKILEFFSSLVVYVFSIIFSYSINFFSIKVGIFKLEILITVIKVQNKKEKLLL